MSHWSVFELDRSFLTRLLQSTALSLALMTASAGAVRAGDSDWRGRRRFPPRPFQL